MESREADSISAVYFENTLGSSAASFILGYTRFPNCSHAVLDSTRASLAIFRWQIRHKETGHATRLGRFFFLFFSLGHMLATAASINQTKRDWSAVASVAQRKGWYGRLNERGYALTRTKGGQCKPRSLGRLCGGVLEEGHYWARVYMERCVFFFWNFFLGRGAVVGLNGKDGDGQTQVGYRYSQVVASVGLVST